MLESIEPSSKPWELIAYDVAGPLAPAADGSRYALIGVDYATDYPIIVPLKGLTTAETTSAMSRAHAEIGGIPSTVITDCAPNFVSTAAKEFYEEQGIKKSTTTPYNPRGNGKAENKVKIVKEILFKVAVTSDWPSRLVGILLALRNQVTPGRSASPHFLLFGRDPPLPPILKKSRPQTQQGRAMADAYKKTRERMKLVKEKQRERYNKGRRAMSYRPGDLVWMKNPTRASKEEPRRLGPFKIKRKHSDLVYELEDSAYANMGRKNPLRHVRLLAPFKERRRVGSSDDGPPEQKTPTPTIAQAVPLTTSDEGPPVQAHDEDPPPEEPEMPEPERDDGTEPYDEAEPTSEPNDQDDIEYRVDRIEAHRDGDDGREFLVEWSSASIPKERGIPPDAKEIIKESSTHRVVSFESSWEREANLVVEDGTRNEALIRYERGNPYE